MDLLGTARGHGGARTLTVKKRRTAPQCLAT